MLGSIADSAVLSGVSAAAAAVAESAADAQADSASAAVRIEGMSLIRFHGYTRPFRCLKNSAAAGTAHRAVPCRVGPFTPQTSSRGMPTRRSEIRRRPSRRTGPRCRAPSRSPTTISRRPSSSIQSGKKASSPAAARCGQSHGLACRKSDRCRRCRGSEASAPHRPAKPQSNLCNPAFW